MDRNESALCEVPELRYGSQPNPSLAEPLFDSICHSTVGSCDSLWSMCHPTLTGGAVRQRVLFDTLAESFEDWKATFEWWHWNKSIDKRKARLDLIV